MTVELRDVADGLWLWRQPHPDWSEGSDWEPEVASFAVESRGAALLLDPLAPPPAQRDVWDRLEPLRPGVELPGGLLALHDGRGTQETPVYLPEQRALVFADALTLEREPWSTWSGA